MNRWIGRRLCSTAWGVTAAWVWLASASTAAVNPIAHLVTDVAVEPLASAPAFAIVPFRYASHPPPLESFDGGVVFGADDGLHGRELWRSEGTPATTRRLRDLCPGPCSGLTSDPVAVGERFFFSATDGASGSELWVSDGTAAGTTRLTDLCWGPCHGLWLSDSGTALAAGPHLFFAAPEAGAQLASPTRQALWVSDGTGSGTYPITPAHQGFVRVLRSFGGRVLAWVDSALWVSDGTVEGTRPLAEILGESSTGAVAGSSGGVLFALGGPPATRWAILAADLSVRPFQPCAWCADGLAPPGPADLYVVLADEDLYRVDAASGRSVRLAHLGGNGPRVDSVAMLGSGVLLAIRRSWNGEPELWRSDGTRAGTAPVVGRPRLGDGGFAVVGGRAFFAGYRPDLGSEPWRSDGTEAGTEPLLDLAPGSASSSPWSFVPLAERVAFLVATPGLAAELFSSDGTDVGTTALVEPRPGPPSSAPEGLSTVGDRLLFSAEDRATGRELWASSGSPESTFRVADLLPGGSSSRPRDFAVHRSGVVFRAAGKLWKASRSLSSVRALTGAFGVSAPIRAAFGVFTYARDAGYCPISDGCSEPFAWRDGQPGLEPTRDIWPGGFSYFPITGGSGAATSLGVDPLPLRAGVIFGAHDGETGLEPWFTDGTPGGTRQVADLCVEPPSDQFAAGSRAHLFRAFGDLAVFATRAGNCAAGLAVSDGSAEGTRFLSQGSGEVEDLLVANGRIWALVRASLGDELWISDGTTSGTNRVVSLSGSQGARAFSQKLTAAGRFVYFTVFRDDTGEELWRSDGTAAGTRMLSLAPGAESAAPNGLREIAGWLAFTASDGVHGAELWVSDGTRRGTRMIEDLAPGADASWPSGMTRVGDRVYFAAADREHGRELWSIDLAALNPRSRSPALAQR